MNPHADAVATRTFRIARSGAGGSLPGGAVFELPVSRRTTVLDALFEVQRRHDPSLAFRSACRVGMCGTCAIAVDGVPRLACQTRVENLPAGPITLEPLPHLPVLKDLIVSLEPFFEKWRAVRPALHAVDPDARTLAVVTADSEFGREARQKRDCITCGACFAACGVKGTSAAYLGPAAINKAFLRLLDPRDGLVDERVALLGREAEGVWRCHTQFNCVAACPKGIPLTDSIVRLKRALLRPRRFHAKLRRNRPQV